MVTMDKGGHGHSPHLIRYYALIRANGQFTLSFDLVEEAKAKTSEGTDRNQHGRKQVGVRNRPTEGCAWLHAFDRENIRNNIRRSASLEMGTRFTTLNMPPMSFLGVVTKSGFMNKTATVAVSRWVIDAKTGKVRHDR
jgi:hypothetical protein